MRRHSCQIPKQRPMAEIGISGISSGSHVILRNTFNYFDDQRQG